MGQFISLLLFRSYFVGILLRNQWQYWDNLLPIHRLWFRIQSLQQLKECTPLAKEYSCTRLRYLPQKYFCTVNMKQSTQKVKQVNGYKKRKTLTPVSSSSSSGFHLQHQLGQHHKDGTTPARNQLLPFCFSKFARNGHSLQVPKILTEETINIQKKLNLFHASISLYQGENYDIIWTDIIWKNK